MDDAGPTNLTGVLDRIESGTEGSETVRADALFDAFAGRLFGPLVIVPGLVLLTPLGAIPLVPAGAGLVVALIAAQRIAGMRRPWLPRRLLERGVERERVVRALDKVRPWTGRVDRVIKPRLSALTVGPAEIGAAVLALVLGLSVPVVGLLPLAAVLPGAGLVLIGLALIGRDGLLMLGAYLVSAAVGYFAWVALF